MGEKSRPGNQDAALFKLLAATLAPHWRPLLVALAMLLATAVHGLAPPYLAGRAIVGCHSPPSLGRR